MHLNGDDLNSPRVVRLQVRREFPSMRTVRRWLNKFNTKGTIHPMRATGNSHANWEVNGVDLVNLALFRLVCPKAYINEVRAYVHNRNRQNPPYSHSQIARAEDRLGMLRKKGSTTSNKAHSDANLHRRFLYRNANAAFPDGVLGKKYL